MDIAVKFEKHNLDEYKCIFKPVGIVRGQYNEKEMTFLSEVGETLAFLDGASEYEEYFFGYPTTIEQLKEKFGKTVSDEALLTNHFSMAMENGYFGFFNDDECIDLFPIPIHEAYDRYLDELESGEEAKATVTFDSEYLKKIRNCKTIEEVRKELDVFLRIIDEAEKDIDEAFKDGKVEVKKASKKKLKVDKKSSKNFNLAKLRKEVLSRIRAQDDAVKRVTTALAVNYTSKNPRHKSHLLIAGPSGTGKTEMISIIAKYLGVPYFRADATAYTKEGYVGKSVQSMLLGLVEAAGGDIEKAQNGILIIDEIDKKSGGDRGDVSGESVLSSLLKIMDRDVVEVNTNYYDSMDFDTSNLTIICMGAFKEVYKKKSKKNSSIGFSNTNEENKTNNSIKITKEDLIDDGMTAEFMGRIDEVIDTKEFTLEDLVEILYTSKDSAIKREREYFKGLNVQTVFRKSFYYEVAKNCLNAGTGARDLKRCTHEALIDAYDAVLMGKTKVKKLIFTADTVKDSKKYYVK